MELIITIIIEIVGFLNDDFTFLHPLFEGVADVLDLRYWEDDGSISR